MLKDFNREVLILKDGSIQSKSEVSSNFCDWYSSHPYFKEPVSDEVYKALMTMHNYCIARDCKDCEFSIWAGTKNNLVQDGCTFTSNIPAIWINQVTLNHSQTEKDVKRMTNREKLEKMTVKQFITEYKIDLVDALIRNTKDCYNCSVDRVCSVCNNCRTEIREWLDKEVAK